MSFFPIIVCGGRDYTERALVYETLDRIRRQYGALHIIEGGATGADRFALDWAGRQLNVRASHVPADWKTHGRAAGPIRNQQMIDEYRPRLVVAFPGGRGTADMVLKAKAAGIEVLEVTLANSEDR